MRKLITLFAIIVPLLVSCKHAVFYEITTKVQPDDAGSIVVSPSSNQVQEGTSVSFTAKSGGEYVFTGWSGSLSGTENPKTVTASSNLNVVANFTLRSYPLTITVEGEGSVAEKVISTKADYTYGTTVELTAQPADHWLFDHWEGDLNGNSNTAQITVTSAKSVKAVFVRKMYDLTVETQGEGAVSEKVVDTKSSYQEGTIVELTATPKDYWVFDHWEGDLTGSNNPARIAVSSSKKVKAVFVEKMYPLTVEIEGNGAVNEKVISTKSGSYQEGTVVELSANPGAHWLFDHWEGDLEGDQNPVQITIMSAQSVKAVFTEKLFPLTVDIQGGGVVKEELVETKGTYQEGSTVKLTATPNTYWAFDHWEGDITGTENPALITISNAASVKAVFVEHDPGIVFTETEYVSPYEINFKLGMGINISCQLDAYREDGDHIVVDETYWGNPKCTQQLFDKLAAVGFKSVRIPITWMGTYGPAPEYKIDENRLNRIAEVVGYAENAGLNAIINMHHDDAYPHQKDEGHTHIDDFWINPEKAATDPSYNVRVKEQLKAMWTQIARRFRDKGDFLIFESFNEPGSEFFWSWATDEEKDAHQAEYDCLSEWNQVFVDAVRSTGGNNARRWLFVVGAAAKERNLNRLVIPQDYVSNNRLVLAIHFWEPESYAAGGYDEWGHTASAINEEMERFNELFISTELALYREKYLDKGIPICIDEMGCFHRDSERGKAFQLYYLEYLVRAAKLNGLATFIWDDGARNGETRGFYLFWHDTGNYFDYSKEVVETIVNAAYSEDHEYTLQSIYDRAPFYNPKDEDPIEITDKNFKGYIVSLYDKDGDGEINLYESRRIFSIDVITDNIESLQGIEYMENLRELRCRGTRDWVGVEQGPGLLTSLDVSLNPKLRLLACNNNKISRLDLSNNPNLEDLCIRSNGMTELDISHNANLLWFDASFNKFTTLDLSSNPKLRHFYLGMNGLTAINGLSGLYDLEILGLNDNHLSSLDVSYNSKLKELFVYNNDLTGIDLLFNSELTTLECFNNPRLATIRVHAGHQFAHLVKDDFTQIVYDSDMIIPDSAFRKYLFDHYDKDGNQSISREEVLDVKEISICTDDIKDLTGIELFENLETLVCEGSRVEEYTGEDYYGQLQYLNVSQNTKLRVLKCSYNKLKEIDVSNNSLLEVLHVHNNDLERIDISKNTLLKEFICRNNHLTALNITKNTKLEDLDCQGSNHITTLDVSNCPEIHLLNANGCGLEAIDVSHNPALSWFGCADSKFETIDLSANPNLYCLYIDSSKIKWIDLTSNQQVEEVYARSCPNLEFIYLKSGQTIRVFEHDEHTQVVHL